MKSIVYGETLWDIFPEEKVIGGASFNFAAHMSHLGNETYFISDSYADTLPFARRMRRKCRQGRRNHVIANRF